MLYISYIEKVIEKVKKKLSPREIVFYRPRWRKTGEKEKLKELCHEIQPN